MCVLNHVTSSTAAAAEIWRCHQLSWRIYMRSHALLLWKHDRKAWVALELNSSQCRHSATRAMLLAIWLYMDVRCVLRSHIITCHRDGKSGYSTHLQIDSSSNKIGPNKVGQIFFSSCLYLEVHQTLQGRQRKDSSKLCSTSHV